MKTSYKFRKQITIGATILMLSLLATLPLKASATPLNDPPGPSPYYIPHTIYVTPRSYNLRSPYNLVWAVTVSGGVGTFSIHGAFGDGAGFTWVNYSAGTYYPNHTFGGSNGTYYQSWWALNQGNYQYDYTTVTKL